VKAFSKPWRTDAYEQHLKLQYPTKWSEYGMASHAEQEASFDVAVDEVAHVKSLDADDAGVLFFWVSENLVLGDIRELSFDPEKGGRVEFALKIVKDDAEGRNAGDEACDGPFCVERRLVEKRLWHSSSLLTTLQAVFSFRQAKMLTLTVTRTGLHKLRGVREEDVARFVRPVAGISLGKIASLLGAMKRGH
jgi:hypothetical protein